MNPPTHNEKRQIFEQHFLFGQLSNDEIDSLIGYTWVEQYPAGRENFRQRIARLKRDGCIAWKHQDKLSVQRRQRSRF